jgi:GDP-4-dehydro-6-deoxy-D-mannose reductase
LAEGNEMPHGPDSAEVKLDPGPILLTGAAGFVGSHLMNELGMGEGDFATDTHDSYTVPRGVSKVVWKLPSVAPDELDEVKYIVHLAAVSSVSRSLKDMHRAYDVNLMGTISVLEFAASRCPRARLLLVSSADVYKPTGDLITENFEIGPINPYGSTKAAAEIAAFQFARSCGLEVLVARPFPHTGPGQSEEFAFPSFCRRIIRAREEGSRRMRVGNLSPVRDYLYITDVTRAYLHILARGQSGGIYNICTGTGSSIGDMVNALMDIAGVSLELEVDPGLLRPVDVEFQVGDPTRIEALLGWHPEVERIEGMRRLFSWWEART